MDIFMDIFIKVNDLIEIEKNISIINKIIEKYGLQIKKSLFNLAIYNKDEYTDDIFSYITSKKSIIKYNKLKKNDKINFAPKIINIDLSEAFKFYLNEHLLKVKNKRKWISFRKILKTFSIWYKNAHGNKIDIRGKKYIIINNVFDDLGLRFKRLRLTGYCIR